MFSLRLNGLPHLTLRSNVVMGRPPKNESEKRVVQVNIRLTIQENDKATQYASASGMDKADWMRQKVFTGKFPVMKLSPIENGLYLELRKIGVNINQGTHKLNQGDFPARYLELQLELRVMLGTILKVLSDDRKSDKR